MFFSIVVPTYNRAGLIEQTIYSLLNQSFNDFEIIVVDDGSTDDTEAIVKRISSNKISYYKIVNSERGFARNYGAKKAKGLYVNFFDSDDIALNNHLEEAHKMVLKYNKPEIFHLNYSIKNTSTGEIRKNLWVSETINNILWKGNVLSCNGVFLKKDVAIQFPFNESRKLSVSEDWDLWLRLSCRFSIYMSPNITSYIIDHNERSVMQYNESKLLDRKNTLIQSLSNDAVFMKKQPHLLNKIEAHMLSYASLHAVLCKYKRVSICHLWGAVKLNPFELFTRRTLAILKHILIA